MRKFLAPLSLAILTGCSQLPSTNGVTAQPPNPATSQTQKNALQSAETTIPYSDLLTYSPDWPEISRRRIAQQP